MVLPRLVTLLLLGLLGGLVVPGAQGQIEELPRPDTADASSFGVSVAIDDSIAVVGASGESVCGDNAGAVYVYERRPSSVVATWSLTARLLPGDCRENAFFGGDVSLSGSRVLVSASSEHFAGEGANAAYIFERDTAGTWQQTARLTGQKGAREGLFAAGVALDGDRAAVSTSGSPDGAYSGAVYVFEQDSTTEEWSRSTRLTASRGVDAGVMGGTVALDDRHLAVAASTFFEQEPGSVYVFEHDPGSDAWTEAALLRDIDGFFIALDLDGSTLLVGEERAGEEGSGVASVFTAGEEGWAKTATLRPSIPYTSGSFGTSVAVHDEWALVTGYDEQLGMDVNIDRVVYVFQRQDNATWKERRIFDIGEVDFGASIDQDGTTALISSVPENEPGTAYVVHLP